MFGVRDYEFRVPVKLKAVIFGVEARYERDLPQNAKDAPFWNIFPHWDASDSERVQWATRVFVNGKQVRKPEPPPLPPISIHNL